MNESVEKDEPVNVSLDVVWHGAAGKYDARLSEISLEKCFIDSMGQEVLGETINFKVRLPSGIWIALQGVVSYQEYPIGFEAKFTNLTGEDRRLLIEVIAAHGGKQAQELLQRESETTLSATQTQKSDRILIADDDVVTLTVLKAIIETRNFQVISAGDGREAFKILQTDDDFCAAIFDMTMPHLDGLDLINYMQTNERLKNIPIGMVTAEQDPKIWNDSLAAGASVFLPKPFTPPQIQMMMNILINEKQAAQ